MTMNSFLADMYGTRETIGADSSQDQDVEKLAEAQMLDQALQAEGYDVDQLDAGTLLKVAYNLFGEDSALVKAAMEEGGDEGEPSKKDKEPPEEETEEEKVASADMLGRVMAHAFVQEQSLITKEAGALGSAKEGLFAAGRAIKGAPGKYAKGLKERARLAKLYAHKGGAKNILGKGLGGRAKLVGKGIKKLAPELAAGTAATAGGVALAKSSSALDTIAEERALEILKEAGVDIGTTEEEKLAAAVEQRAWEMLEAEGFVE